MAPFIRHCDNGAMRFFNTAGPVRRDEHYHVPPLERIDLEAVLGLVRSGMYFVLHAPRQTGKTSALLALRDLLNGGSAGDCRCVYANFRGGAAGARGHGAGDACDARRDRPAGPTDAG